MKRNRFNIRSLSLTQFNAKKNVHYNKYLNFLIITIISILPNHSLNIIYSYSIELYKF